MTRLITLFIKIITKLHDKIMSINDNHGWMLTDKQLHFLVIGLFGLGILIVLQPILSYLAKKDKILIINFIYVFSLITVLTFAIEIGQWISGTGTIDIYDVVSGMGGFITFFIIYGIIYLIYKKNKKID